VLEAFGFRADLAADNAPPALTVLAVNFAIVPALLGLGGAALISGHTMDRASHEKIRQALAARDGV
jgi:Na+/melibiose symporter-like transporter